jgi:3-oxoacyl-[acyl-carrier protein] reductase
MESLGYTYGAQTGLSETVRAVEERGRRAVGISADVTNEEQVRALIAGAIEHFGRLDILVNVAGGSWGSNRIADYESEQWWYTVKVNLFGPFLTTKYALPHFEQQQRGVIVNISSIAAVRSHAMISAYGAAKAGLVQFTRDTAVEYGPSGIRAYALMPGDIQTDLLAMELRSMALFLDMSEEEVAAMSAESTPLRRLGTPEDVANVVGFLCSDRAAFLTGLAIPVTGGKELPFRGH